jgi:hypothetical protein
MQAVQLQRGKQNGTDCWAVSPLLTKARHPLVRECHWHQRSVGFVSITENEKAGLLHDTATDHRNPNNYVVELDVFHQLHCLVCTPSSTWWGVFGINGLTLQKRALRKQVWYPAFIDIKNDSKTVWEVHLGALLLLVLCSPCLPLSIQPTHFPYSDHCLDYLRHSLMCNAALTPTTFYWDEEKRGYHPTEAMPHTCVVFDKIW